MAEKTVISIEVNGVDRAIGSLADFKRAKKDLTEASILGDKKAAASLAELTDKMEDLTDATKTLKGSGVEKIGSSFGLLGQGFKDFDFDKIKTGFNGVGSAMKAIPIFLIIEGITYLIEHWKELSEGNGIVAKSLQFLESIFTEITDTIYKFTDAIGLTNTALEKQGEAIKTFADKSNEALQSQMSAFDRQIAVAKAAGKSTVELEKQKQQAIIDTNLLIAKQIEAFVRAGGELDEEKRKQLNASLEFIRNAKVQEFVINEADNKVKEEQYKKHLEAKQALDSEFRQAQRDLDIQNEKLKNENLSDLQKELLGKKKENLEVELPEIQGIEEKYRQIDYENLKSWNDKKQASDLQTAKNGLEAASQAIQGTQALSDIFFAQKLSKAKKGSAEENEIAKKQFEVNKKLQIANATIQGAQGVLAAYASGSAIPIIGAVAGPLYAAAAGLVAINNIRKIKATEFAGGTPDVSATTATSPSLPTSNGTPSINTQTQNTTTFTGNNNNNNTQQPIKVYLPETDINNANKSAEKIRVQATF